MTEMAFELEIESSAARAPAMPPAAASLSRPADTNGRESDRLARFYMTSDLRAATGLTRTHLDYYLREGLIVPTARTESGYLLFDDRELEMLRAIIAQRRAGLGIREIKQRLGRRGVRS
ncbi:MAG: MerR family transcriptional regulator [Thermomicrobiales bacterium]